MNADSILSKTDKGAEEIATRKYKLDPKLRTLLIMVNGTSTAAQLAQKFAGMDIQPQLAQLEREGYVKAAAGVAATSTGADIKKIRMEVSRALTDLLGPDAESMAMKIEQCATVEALRDFLEQRKQTLSSALGRKAPDFWSRTETLIRA
ncbi:MAG TPA: hypothetical protein VD965_00250 [Burkholderiales bacterium]|nr:hypothetical protein [Burkholderiales bacterium]